MKKHIITEQEYVATREIAKRNKHKRVDKRLQVIILRYEGLTDQQIGDKLGFHRKWVSRLCAEFIAVGLDEYARHKYGGNNQALSDTQEREIIDKFRKEAESGHLVTVKAIKSAFDEKRSKDTGRGYIYQVLERHSWRKVMPRGKHPKKASDEAIEASKKLTNLIKN